MPFLIELIAGGAALVSVTAKAVSIALMELSIRRLRSEQTTSGALIQAGTGSVTEFERRIRASISEAMRK